MRVRKNHARQQPLGTRDYAPTQCIAATAAAS